MDLFKIMKICKVHMHIKMDPVCYLSLERMFSSMNSKGLQGQKYKRIRFGEKCWKLLWLNDVIYNINKIGLRLCGKVMLQLLENAHYILHFERDNLGGALCYLRSLLRCKVGLMYFVDLWFKTNVVMEGAKLFLTSPLKARSFGECTLRSLLSFV
jgi:hypothetical protein